MEQENEDWTKAELKDYHIYRKGIWVLKRSRTNKEFIKRRTTKIR